MKTKEFYGHEVQALPERVDQVYMYIRERPGIDAPEICKDIVLDHWGYSGGMLDRDRKSILELSGHELANYLGDCWGGTWNEVCESIDWLLERGRITFSDDGELNCVE